MGSPSHIGSGIPVRGTRLHGSAGVFGPMWTAAGEKLEHGKLQCLRSVQSPDSQFSEHEALCSTVTSAVGQCRTTSAKRIALPGDLRKQI